MVNKAVLDYLRKYKDKYNLEDLRKKIISTGYGKEEVEEALIALGLRKSAEPARPQPTRPKPTRPQPSGLVAEPARPQPTKPKPSGLIAEPAKAFGVFKLPSTSYSKWLKIAGISGILTIIFIGLASFFEVYFVRGAEFQFIPISIVFSLLASISLILFFYGFVVLGKRYDKRLIKIVGLVFIIFMALFAILHVLLMIFPDIINKAFIDEIISQTQAGFDYSALLGFLSYVIILAIMGLFCLVLNILFGIGLIKLKENIKSKLAGILHIVGACLLVVGVGVLVLAVAFILEIILLFKVSKQI